MAEGSINEIPKEPIIIGKYIFLFKEETVIGGKKKLTIEGAEVTADIGKEREIVADVKREMSPKDVYGRIIKFKDFEELELGIKKLAEVGVKVEKA